MFKLELEKAEEPEIKLPSFVESQKKQQNSRNIPTSALLTIQKPLTVWITKNCEKLTEIGIPESNRTEHGTADRFQIRKGVTKGCILSPCLFKLYAEYILRNAQLDEAQAGIMVAGRNINNLRYTDDTTFMAERRTKEPLDESERGE